MCSSQGGPGLWEHLADGCNAESEDFVQDDDGRNLSDTSLVTSRLGPVQKRQRETRQGRDGP